MKIETTPGFVSFQPVKISLTFESADELKAFAAILNTPAKYVKGKDTGSCSLSGYGLSLIASYEKVGEKIHMSIWEQVSTAIKNFTGPNFSSFFK